MTIGATIQLAEADDESRHFHDPCGMPSSCQCGSMFVAAIRDRIENYPTGLLISAVITAIIMPPRYRSGGQQTGQSAEALDRPDVNNERIPKNGCQMIIALEEHYMDREISLVEGLLPVSAEAIKMLEDLSEARLAVMDDAGIDIQVLSLCIPGMETVTADRAATLAVRLNDLLKASVDTQPRRFAAFAALPTADPLAAAAELERCVDKLGFKGAMVNGLTQGAFLDHKRFWPIFERAAALDVPVYIHPGQTNSAVAAAYYADYAAHFPMFAYAAWGSTVEMGTQAIRLVLSGVFDAYPALKIIMGHMERQFRSFCTALTKHLGVLHQSFAFGSNTLSIFT